ncbi:unnamed protein product [Schistosoma turkestanicum]|nr:unnamed protein product [Schistosoma turkestanicum]
MIQNILKNQPLFSTLPFSNGKQPSTTLESTETIATAMRIQSQDVGHAILIRKSPVNHLGELTKLPSSTALNNLINYHTHDSAVLDECKGVEIAKDNHGKELPNDSYISESLCSAQEKNISTDENIVYNSKCTPIKPPNIEICPSKNQVSVMSHVIDKKNQLGDDCENHNEPIIKHPLNDDIFDEIPLESSFNIPKTNKSSDVVGFCVPERSYDLLEVMQNKIVVEPNVSSDIRQSESLQLRHQDKYNEIESDSSDNDDFIEVDTHEQVEMSNTSTNSDSSRTSSTVESNYHDESKLNSVLKKKELVSNQQESILSSSLPEDDFAIDDDDILREEADRLMRQAQTTTTRCISEAQDLLSLFGFPFVFSPEEAEAQCVALQRHGLVDLVASDDSDVWPFGVKLVCRHLFGTTGGDNLRRTTNPSIYKLDEVKRKLGLTIENILRLTLLCGSDYTRGIDQVGPVTALEIISEFDEADDDSLNCEINNWLNGIDEPSEKLINYILKPLKQFTHWWETTRSQNSPQSMKILRLIESNPIRRRWINLKPYPGFPDSRIARAYLYPNVKIDLPSFKWESPSVPLLVKHVNTILGWNTEKTEALLASVLKHRQHMELGNPGGILSSKSLITNYFQIENQKFYQKSEVGSSELDEVTVPSKRVRHAASRLRNQRTKERSLKTPSTSQVKDENSLLSELPKPHKPRRRQSMRKPLDETNNLRKKRSRIKRERRIVERVCLSEDED